MTTYGADLRVLLEPFLRTILARPILTNYVRSLDIRWPISQVDIDRDPQSATIVALYTAAARDLGLLKSLTFPGVQVALLLLLLPNVRSLKLFPSRVLDMFDEFLEETVVLPTGALQPLLKSLRDVTYYYEHIVLTPKSLAPVLNLPSIRKIEVHGGGNMNQFDFALSAYTGRSSVTGLYFWHCSVCTASLTRLLAIPLALTHFTYLDRTGNPGLFESALFGRGLRGSRSTLQYLRLTFANMYRFGPPAVATLDSLGSLQDYPVLRSVWCSLSVMLGRNPLAATARVVHVLPAVVEEFRVGNQAFDYWKYSQVVEQVLEMLELKRVGGGFGKLAKVTLMPRETGEAEEPALRAACDAVGVVLVVNRNIFV